MDLRLLTTFKTVVDAGSVTAAADVLLVSQPALSRQLQRLEREVGVALFARHGGRLALTAAGRQFLAATSRVLMSVEAASSLASTLAAGRLAEVRMAAPTTTLTDVLAPFIAELRPEDPLITIEEASYASAVAGLQTGLDLAILTAPPPRALDKRQVAALPVWAHVSPAHPWSHRHEVSVSELAEQPLVVLDPTARARQLLDAALADEGLAATSLIECRNPQVAQSLAAAGRGVAILSDDPRFGLHPLHVRGSHGSLTLMLHAAWEPAHHASAELERLALRLRDFCLARYAGLT